MGVDLHDKVGYYRSDSKTGKQMKLMKNEKWVYGRLDRFMVMVWAGMGSGASFGQVFVGLWAQV